METDEIEPDRQVSGFSEYINHPGWLPEKEQTRPGLAYKI